MLLIEPYHPLVVFEFGETGQDARHSLQVVSFTNKKPMKEPVNVALSDVSDPLHLEQFIAYWSHSMQRTSQSLH